jgi:NAD(P)-dependent dehydrogenase (short-subunit alcohol dehydrogenase family)
MAAYIKSEVGYINLLVNNAGIMGNSRHNGIPMPAPFPSKPGAENYGTIEDVQAYLWKDTMEDWDAVFRVNTTGAWFTSVAFLALLAEGNKREVVEQTSQVR